MSVMKRKRYLWKPVLLAGIFLLSALWFFSAMDNLYRGGSEAGREQLENALRRSAVACYAAEGIYPPTLDYLTEHYGVQIGEEYTVFYEIFASNLMPEITVLKKGAK
ncbi:MAG: hypothetical protein IJP33_05165 [Firmicutes bacterium]|nr:hypothetical protein [Bacillota bacterium]